MTKTHVSSRQITWGTLSPSVDKPLDKTRGKPIITAASLAPEDSQIDLKGAAND